MKILVVCQHYWPEPYPLPDICEELVRRGHTVHLITDVPNYPMGITYPEYKKHRHRHEEHNGVEITRTFTIARRHNAVFRLLNYYGYALSSSHYARQIKEDYDVIFTNQTSPVMMSRAAFAYAKKHHKKVVMYCMDLWPACLTAGGLSESSLIYKFFGKVSKKAYEKPDKILITSQMFSDYLVKQHLHNDLAKSILCDWWKEYTESKSRRDQLALPFVIWKHGLKMGDIGDLGSNLLMNPKFRIVNLGAHSFR